MSALRLRSIWAAPVSLVTTLPVPGDDLAGCCTSWRRDLPQVGWDAKIASGCLGWAQYLAERYMVASNQPDLRHSRAWPAQECLYAGLTDWSGAFDAWLKSPPHLDVIRHTRATRVGMGGVFVAGTADHSPRAFWVLRVAMPEV
jgi:uncharacterized protein YkwD